MIELHDIIQFTLERVYPGITTWLEILHFVPHSDQVFFTILNYIFLNFHPPTLYLLEIKLNYFFINFFLKKI